MHDSVYKWVQLEVDKYELADTSVLEVGSLDVNGSCRKLFHGPYWGIDIRDGPGVDEVWDIEKGESTEWDRFDVVLCTEVLEPVLRPQAALDAMICAGRSLLLTCRGFDDRGMWPYHEEPIDVWRFSDLGLAALLDDTGYERWDIACDPEGPGWFVHAWV